MDALAELFSPLTQMKEINDDRKVNSDPSPRVVLRHEEDCVECMLLIVMIRACGK